VRALARRRVVNVRPPPAVARSQAGSRFFGFDLARVCVPKRQWQRHADSELVLISVGALIVSDRTDAYRRPAFIERESDFVALLLQIEHVCAHVVVALARRE
jgi:hypothetical protein